MNRLINVVYYIACALMLELPAYSQNTESIPTHENLTEEIDQILRRLKLIEERLANNSPEQLAFDFERPNRSEKMAPIGAKWYGPKKLTPTDRVHEPLQRIRIDLRIDAGMLLDGYQRNMQNMPLNYKSR